MTVCKLPITASDRADKCYTHFIGALVVRKNNAVSFRACAASDVSEGQLANRPACRSQPLRLNFKVS